MEKIFKNLVEKLIEKNLTISSMESCTGGMFVNQLTNISGASNIIKVSIVTYSNEYKIKFGVDKETINRYTVYSTEVAEEMSKNIAKFANSNIGVGITGQIGNEKIDEVFVSIYYNRKFYDYKIDAIGKTRNQKKEFIVKYIAEKLLKNIISDI